MAVKYTDEIKEFLSKNRHRGYTYLLSEVKSRYNLDVTYQGLRMFCNRNKIKIKQFMNWDGYVLDYIENNHNEFTIEEMIIELEEKFNYHKTISSLHHLYSRKGWKAKKKKCDVGTEKEMLHKKNHPVTYIKYRDLATDSSNSEYEVNWMPKKRWVYIQHYGNIPENYCVIQLDGDKNNYNIDNLRAIPKSIMPKITKKYGYGIITEAMIEICMLEEDLRRLEE